MKIFRSQFLSAILIQFFSEWRIHELAKIYERGLALRLAVIDYDNRSISEIVFLSSIVKNLVVLCSDAFELLDSKVIIEVYFECV